jgi:N-acetylglucosamine malate deacetylase 2
MHDSQALFHAVVSPRSEPGVAPRTLVFVAHSDDETIALGSRLSRHRDSLFLHATDGAPSEESARYHGFPTLDAYRDARRDEVARALLCAGLRPEQCHSLDIPDQQLSLRMGDAAERLHRALVEHAPAAILTHPYEGGHPDHDACAAITAAALRRLPAAQRPLHIEAAFYHQGPDGIQTGQFLPGSGDALVFSLDRDEQRVREQLLNVFATQADTLSYFFTKTECFRVAPAYDFSLPPHPGKLFYEQFAWGMTGARFRELAAELLR